MRLLALTTLVPLVFANPLNLDENGALHQQLVKKIAEIKEAVPRNEGASLECDGCRATIDVLRFLISNTALSEECFGAIIDYGCDVLRIEDNRVCDGIQSEFREEILYVVAKIFIEPKEVCGLLIDNCGSPYNPLTANWTFPIPPNKPPLQQWTLPKKGSPTLRIVQISDMHYDKLYSPGSEAACGEPLCCRAPPLPGTKLKRPAGLWGTPANCDIPQRTVELMLDHIAKEVKADALYWTGDLNPHNVWNQSRSDQIFDLQQLTTWFTGKFPPGFVFPAVGNHESAPCDSFPPHWAPVKYGSAWLYDTLGSEWTKLGSPIDADAVRFRASYSLKPWAGLRLVSLNTMMGDNLNFWLYANESDPDGTMAWLSGELRTAEAAGEKVHIIGHIPPGPASPGALPAWAHNFYQLINRFANTIRGQFYGHTHDDQFQLFYEDERYPSRPTQVAYIAPSMTTYSYHAPSFRVYTVDGAYPGSTFVTTSIDNPQNTLPAFQQVLDTETYVLDIDTLNRDNVAKFNLEYSALKDYEMASLTPHDWDKLILRMKSDNGMFLKYFQHFSHKPASVPQTKCDAYCRNKQLCSMRSGKPKSEAAFCMDLDLGDKTEQTAEKTQTATAALSRLPETIHFSWINRIIAACKKAG